MKFTDNKDMTILKDIKTEDSPLGKAVKEADERRNRVEKELLVATQRLNSLTSRVNFLEEALSKQTTTIEILLNNLKNKGLQLDDE